MCCATRSRCTTTAKLPMTGVVLHDSVPANTTYVADSVTLNGLPVGRPDGGVSPLDRGHRHQLRRPDAAAAGRRPGHALAGQLRGRPVRSARERRRADGHADQQPGRRAQQGAAGSADGRRRQSVDGTGADRRRRRQRSAAQHHQAGRGRRRRSCALPARTLEYLVRVTNISLVPAHYVVITDDLAMPVPGYLTFVDQSATMNGSATGITVAGSLITADYSTDYGPLQPGQSILLRFRAVIDAESRDRHEDHEHRRRYVERPTADRARQRVDRCRRHRRRRHSQRHGVARRQLQRRDRRQRAPARGLDGRALSQRSARALDAHRLPTVSTRSAASCRTTRRQIATSCGSSHPAPDPTPPSSAERSRSSPTTCSASRTSSCRPAAICRISICRSSRTASSTTRSRARRSRAPILRMLQAGSRTALPESCFYDPAQQNQVTLRERLLPLRHQLLRSGVRERRQLPHRCRGAVVGLRRRLLADHSAGVGPVDRPRSRCPRVREARPMRSRPRRSAARCRFRSSRRRPRCGRAPRAPTITCT